MTISTEGLSEAEAKALLAIRDQYLKRRKCHPGDQLVNISQMCWNLGEIAGRRDLPHLSLLQMGAECMLGLAVLEDQRPLGVKL